MRDKATHQSAVRSRPSRASVVAFLHVWVPLAGAAVALWSLTNRLPDRRTLAVAGILYLLTFLGVTIGFHRYLSHGAFRTSRPVEAVLIVLASMAAEGTPLFWVASHRCHHARADQDGDPHRPAEGLLHAQASWLWKARCHPDYETYGGSLLPDRTVMRLNRLYPLWLALSLLVPLVVAGLPGLVWAGFVRIALVHHVGWAVNTLCHTVGRRPFHTVDNSRNVPVLGLLAMGDGWHNNHHAFPRSAFHGLRWWQVDLSGGVIRVLEASGLVWDVQRVTPVDRQARSAPARQ